MFHKQPPAWLVNSIIVTAGEFTTDIDKWEYRNSYYERPLSIDCPHCGPGKESIVHLHTVANDEGQSHVIGKCAKCERVYWTELLER